MTAKQDTQKVSPPRGKVPVRLPVEGTDESVVVYVSPRVVSMLKAARNAPERYRNDALLQAYSHMLQEIEMQISLSRQGLSAEKILALRKVSKQLEGKVSRLEKSEGRIPEYFRSPVMA
ncbi:hypothetical protein EII12_06140 [Buchananella hordeovulneris]|uniref:hypothetical protein n=1 Tax=Buchananella hordeovulneris TaxID=52770 RepID=UPI000F5F7BD7|nr:hypothetical protein [Buchananella hordeovulneris]RRD52059.1 hypothetical protein EII12_06140 [Buchananella hordeovulneris]